MESSACSLNRGAMGVMFFLNRFASQRAHSSLPACSLLYLGARRAKISYILIKLNRREVRPERFNNPSGCSRKEEME